MTANASGLFCKYLTLATLRLFLGDFGVTWSDLQKKRLVKQKLKEIVVVVVVVVVVVAAATVVDLLLLLTFCFKRSTAIVKKSPEEPM